MPETKPHSDIEESTVSAFAYETAQAIETYITARYNQLDQRNKDLEALILGFYAHIKEIDMLNGETIRNMYKKHFGIETKTYGETDGGSK